MSDAEKPHVYVPPGEQPPAQLEIEDLEVGEGAAATAGQQVEAAGDRGDTFTVGLGQGQVIKRWDDGVAGMRVGGRRRIVIPPALAYGKRSAGGVIGPDETLV